MIYKRFFFFIVFLTCFFINIQKVYADCENKQEQFPVSASSSIKNGKLYPTLKTGESICGVSAINPVNSLRSSIIYKCNNSNGMDPTHCATGTMDMAYNLCSSYINDKGENEAFCYRSGEYFCEIGTNNKSYYQNNYLNDALYDKNFIAGNQEFCFDNVRKKCSPGPNQKGIWTEIQDCGGLSNCVNILSSDDRYMNTECKTRCTNPPGNIEDQICGVDDKGTPVVRWCYFSDSKWHNWSLVDKFKDSSCTTCEDTIDGPICGNVNIDPDKNRCIKIDGEGSVLRGDHGSFICNKDRTKLYECNINSTDYIKGQNYSFHTDCKSIGLECGIGDDKKIKCITSDEAGRHNQTSSMTITTTSNDEFWCRTDDNKMDYNKINTAIGCIPITVNGLVEKLLPTIFGIAGGIAFLMMVYGFIMISTSSGDEKKVQAAKQIVTSAITGLLVAIFSLFLYRLIAVDILKIPGIN